MCLAFLYYINDKGEAKKLPKLMNTVFLSSKNRISVFKRGYAVHQALRRIQSTGEFGENLFFHPYPTIIF